MKKIHLEDWINVFIVLCPILDILSFVFRNHFNTNISPATILRPIIPAVLFVILFFKEKNKKNKIIIGIMYTIYSLIHLYIFQKLHNGSSYGNIRNEFQYITNYSLMIMNVYIFSKVFKDKEKLNKSVFISLSIYLVSIFISIVTKTSSSTYLEGIGYKGYFESGNSLCTVIILSVCILLANLEKRDWKTIIVIILSTIYLCAFSGMRTGLFGIVLIIAIWGVSRFFISIREKNKISKKQIILITSCLILTLIIIVFLGSQVLVRRKMLKENELLNIDSETGEQRHVSGDILDIYKSIKNGTIEENYMSEAEKKSIIELVEIANKTKLSNVNLRKQQLIYNVLLVKNQKNIFTILFGNGYKNQTGELVVEMEMIYLWLNFGIIGFILYAAPFILIFIYGTYIGIKNIKNITLKYIVYLSGLGLAMALSTLSGYVLFNISSMTFTIILNVLLLKEMGEIIDEKDSIWYNKFRNWWSRKSSC